MAMVVSTLTAAGDRVRVGLIVPAWPHSSCFRGGAQS